jgi:hypothetical protein
MLRKASVEVSTRRNIGADPKCGDTKLRSPRFSTIGMQIFMSASIPCVRARARSQRRAALPRLRLRRAR